MNAKILSIAVILLSLAILSAGCTSKPAPAATPVPTPEVTETTEVPTEVVTAATTTKAAGALVPSPTDSLPDYQEVTIAVEKAGTYSTTIMTSLNGGKGMSAVSRMDVRVTKSDGTVVTDGIDKPRMGTIIEIEGTRGNDRAEVILTMNSGKVYKVIDQMVPYKSRS